MSAVRRRLGVALAVVLASITLVIALNGRAVTLVLITALVRLEFPGVPVVSATELAELQPAPLLLDVREGAEFEVSHLPGARRVEPGAPIPAELLAMSRETPIVTYCAVGRRSAAFASDLKAAGFTGVRNLDGSIFRWANEGRPLVTDTGVATAVHPYNRFWALLVRSDRRASASGPGDLHQGGHSR